MMLKSKISLVAVLSLAVSLAADDGIIIRKNQRTLEQINSIYSQMDPVRYSPPPARWIRVATRPFRHRNPKVEVKWMRVKLYGYWPPGVVEFDDVVLRKVQVEGESADEEDERMRRAYEGKDPGEAFEEGGGQ